MMRTVLWLSLALTGSVGVCADASGVSGVTFPPIRFAGMFAGDSFYTRVQQSAMFQKLSRESYGSPLELRVYHTFHSSTGGKVGGTVSGLLAASSLGILPVSNSGEHAIVYDLVVNGVVLTSYSYQKSFSRVFNIWSKDTTYGLGQEGLDWALSTADQFLRDVAGDPKIAELLAEYDYYFPSRHS